MRPSLSLALALSLSACKDKSGDTGPIPMVDDDGDGFYSVETGGDDCDDTDPEINPDAAEYCDGIDNNCNGDIDADDGGVRDTVIFSIDRDGDGYGDPELKSSGCEQPSGTVDNADDCDDNDDAIFPGADEFCNDIDDDCDGEIDEEALGRPTFYVDADGDGFGDLEDTEGTKACELPSGYSETNDDCDDGRASTYPGADETCGDGIDSDCNGWDGGSELVDDLDLACAPVRLYASAGVGNALDAVGDLTGDGEQDVAISGLEESAWVFSGPLSGGYTSTDAPLTLSGPDSGDALTVSYTGDVDGDGYDDLWAGSPGHDDSSEDMGAAWLVYGPITGGVDASTAMSLQVVGETADSAAGYATAPAGDIDEDGVVDLLVSATGYAEASARTGAVYLVSGALTGDLSLTDVLSDFGGGMFDGARGSHIIGAALLGDIDLDGDGVSDAVVGAPGDDYLDADAGAIYTLYGPLSGGAWSESYRIYGVGEGDSLGSSLAAAGDADEDGYPDFWASAPFSDEADTAAGLLYLMHGHLSNNEDITEHAVATLSGVAEDDNAGMSVVGGRDVNGDGIDDVVIGAPRDEASSGTGGAYVVLGPFSGAMSLADAYAVTSGGRSTDHIGESVLLLPDITGDELAEVVVGVPGDDTADVDAGGVYLWFGSLSAVADR